MKITAGIFLLIFVWHPRAFSSDKLEPVKYLSPEERDAAIRDAEKSERRESGGPSAEQIEAFVTDICKSRKTPAMIDQTTCVQRHRQELTRNPGSAVAVAREICKAGKEPDAACLEKARDLLKRRLRFSTVDARMYLRRGERDCKPAMSRYATCVDDSFREAGENEKYPGLDAPASRTFEATEPGVSR